MQNALQAALLAAGIKKQPKAAPEPAPVAAKPRQASPRRVPFGTWHDGRLAVLDGLDRTTESKPPPEPFPTERYFGHVDTAYSYHQGADD